VGNGETIDVGKPVLVTGLPPITAIACGGYHSLALSADGDLYAWGYGNSGRLGNTGPDYDQHLNITRPCKVLCLPKIIQIGTGLSHSMAICEDGHIYCWGRNGDNQLGDDIYEQPYYGITIKNSQGKKSSSIYWKNHVYTGPGNAIMVKAHWQKLRLLWLALSDQNSFLSSLPVDLIIVIQAKFMLL